MLTLYLLISFLDLCSAFARVFSSSTTRIDIATRTKSDSVAKIAASWEEEDN